jgi:hypothetical protein
MPIHSFREALGPRRVNVIPSEGERAGPATTSGGPDGWGEGSEEEKLRKVATVGPPRGSDGRTRPLWEQGLEGGLDRFPFPSGEDDQVGGTSGGQGLREEYPPQRGEDLEGRSPRTLRCFRASVGRVVMVAKEVAKPRTRRAVVEGSTATHSETAWLIRVVGQQKSRRGSIVGRVHPASVGGGRDGVGLR